MILMWLGSFVLMLFGLSESQKHLAHLLAGMQKNILDQGLNNVVLQKMFVRALGVVVLETSPQRSLYSGMALYNLRVMDLRPCNLQMALSPLGSWWVLILGVLFLNLNGFFLLGFCALGLFSGLMTTTFKNILKWIFATGIFFVGGELLLRNSSILQTLLSQSEWAFFLADGRFSSVFVLLFLAVLVSLIVQIEFWSLALALSLLLTSTLSFNGALGLVAGERIGRMILFWWRSRSLNQDCQRIGRQLSIVSILGVVAGFLLPERRAHF